MLHRLGETYTPCKKETVKDSRNVQHSPVGKVVLRWHKNEQGKSHGETFFVVNSPTPIVILGATAFGDITQSFGGNLYPLGVHPQTAADMSSVTEEEKRVMDEKKLEIAHQRETQKKDQEAKEAEQRRQGAQKK
ncbi:MAG: hypothetical protein Q9209_005275 [Squamulea sp. 1 TL-2023]